MLQQQKADCCGQCAADRRFEELEQNFRKTRAEFDELTRDYSKTKAEIQERERSNQQRILRYFAGVLANSIMFTGSITSAIWAYVILIWAMYSLLQTEQNPVDKNLTLNT